MKVFYDKRQTAKNKSFSPSAGKPARVLKSWESLELNIEVCSFKPAQVKELALAHDERYVRDVLSCRQHNGFGNTLQSIALSLPWTTGSMLAAARHAATTGETSVSPTSGFHHARFGGGGGFCTFNGLMVAAQVLKREGIVDRVGILDLDAHYGNGTEDIIRHLGLGYIEHYTFGGHSIHTENAEEWLASLPEIVRSFEGCSVVLFQAGADPHIDDPLGGTLTTEQMKRRDRIVFETLREIGVPVAWNLAGGYQSPIEKVLEIHNNTAIQSVVTYEESDDEQAA